MTTNPKESVARIEPPDLAGFDIVDIGDRAADWDALVLDAGHATFCHLAAWRDIFTDVLGHECIYRAALDAEGRCRGVLPLVRMRSLLFGHRLISVPFLNYGGPLGSPAARRRLTSWALEEARRSGADRLELRSRHEPAATGDFVPAREKITVTMRLPDEVEALWKDSFGSKLRSQIRRPQKEGMKTQFGPAQLDTFYDVFRRNMRDLGTPVLPRELFARIERAFGDSVVIAAVYHEDRPAAAGFGFVFGDEFELTWASSLRELNRLAPNMLLYWSLMEHMIGRGVRVFNFGRCTPGGGTHRFKRQWGGEDEDLPWAEWSRRGARSDDASSGRVREFATAAWRRLPMPVADRLGPIVARGLPWW